MTSTVGQWNDMFDTFLDDLSKTFPEEKKIKKYKSSFELLRSTNPKKCMELFMGQVGPYTEKINNEDESFFLGEECDIEILNELNIKKYWTAELSANTKSAIWQYLKQLIFVGNMINMLPPGALNMIDNMTKQLQDSMGGDANALTEGGEIDEKALTGLLSSLTSMLPKKS
jgi:hypothetical protein